MSLIGEVNYFLGLEIKQLNKGIFVSQTKYCNEFLKRFGMNEAKIIDTTMAKNGNLKKDEYGKGVDIKAYRCMIGSLINLNASTPDIMFSVCMCARYQSCPKESHLKAVKSIPR